MKILRHTDAGNIRHQYSSSTSTMEASVPVRMGIRCPLSMQVFQDPVTCMDGHVYERAMIMEWFETHETSPMTGAVIEPHMVSAFLLKDAIQGLIKTDHELMMDQYGWLPSVEILIDPEMTRSLVDHHVMISFWDYSDDEKLVIINLAPDEVLKMIIDNSKNRSLDQTTVFEETHVSYNANLFGYLCMMYRVEMVEYFLKMYPHHPILMGNPFPLILQIKTPPISDRIRRLIKLLVVDELGMFYDYQFILNYLVVMREPELIRQVFQAMMDECPNRYNVNMNGVGTPLTTACQLGYEEGVQLLIELGDDPNHSDIDHVYPIEHLYHEKATDGMFDAVLVNGGRIVKWDQFFARCPKERIIHLLEEYTPAWLYGAGRDDDDAPADLDPETCSEIVVCAILAADISIIRLIPAEMFHRFDKLYPDRLYCLAAQTNSWRFGQHLESLEIRPNSAAPLWQLSEHLCPAIKLADLIYRLADPDLTYRLDLLVKAACCGNRVMVNWLLRHGVSFNRVDAELVVEKFSRNYRGTPKLRKKINRLIRTFAHEVPSGDH